MISRDTLCIFPVTVFQFRDGQTSFLCNIDKIYTSLFAVREMFDWLETRHAVKFGTDVRWLNRGNRDSEAGWVDVEYNDHAS